MRSRIRSRLPPSLRSTLRQTFLSAIARECAKGRDLLIGTTDLDARQPVVWDTGAIASSEDPHALLLFRKVLLASAAIPGIFPPVMFDVTVAGHHYHEMHGDGGVISQIFLFPPPLIQMLVTTRVGKRRGRTVYIIRNGRIDPCGNRCPAARPRSRDGQSTQ
jgi:hypothetical protein